MATHSSAIALAEIPHATANDYNSSKDNASNEKIAALAEKDLCSR